MISVIYVMLKTFVLSPFLVIYSIFDKKKNKRCHLWGIEGYFGLMGQGKTISMTRRLQQLRKKYGSNIYIMTNYNFNGQDFEFFTWKQLLNDYDRPLVVAWDEVQNEFNSRDFKTFPVSLLTQLTQVRKKNGVLLLYSAQRWARVDKIFRELTMYAWQCKTLFGCFTIAHKYHGFDYEQLVQTVSSDRKLKIHPLGCISFIQRKVHRNSFNSFKMLETAKSKKYMNRAEVKAVAQE